MALEICFKVQKIYSKLRSDITGGNRIQKKSNASNIYMPLFVPEYGQKKLSPAFIFANKGWSLDFVISGYQLKKVWLVFQLKCQLNVISE